MTVGLHWRERVGNQRDWVWRGRQIRYTYTRPRQNQHLATPVILLHGFGASIGHWRHNIEVLGERHAVYALDMLGWGASEKAPVNYSVCLWVEQVYEFWKAFIGQPVVLIGNSLGSLVCLAAADAHPEMVKGVIMMSLPDPTLEEEAIPAMMRPVVMPIVRATKSLVASPFLLKPLFKFLRQPKVLRRWAGLAYANSEAVTDDLIDIIAGPAQDRGSTRAFIALFKSSIKPDYSPRVKALLPNLTVPMLLIWGQKDRFVPPNLANIFAKYNQDLKVLLLDNVGHCPHDECPERINKVIIDWIEGNGE